MLQWLKKLLPKKKVAQPMEVCVEEEELQPEEESAVAAELPAEETPEEPVEETPEEPAEETPEEPAEESAEEAPEEPEDKTPVCPQCGKALSESAKFCKQCGAKIPQLAGNKNNGKFPLVLLAVPVAGIVLVVALLVTLIWGVPSMRYKKAVSMMEAGAYQEAMVVFTKLDDFKDSPQKVLECQYGYAKSLMDAGAYEDAVAVFAYLGTYEDSAAQILECKYREALILLEDGKYPEAIEAFTKLGSYRDSKELIKECKYRTNLAILAEGKYTEAMEGFIALGDYKDSPDQVKECKYQLAIILINEGNVVEGYEAMVALGNYKDSAQKANYLSDTYQMIKAKPNMMTNSSWTDQYTQRCYLYITVVDTNTLRIEIYGSGGADNYTQWQFICTWDASTGHWKYTGGQMKEKVYYPWGGSWVADSYSNGTGFFYYKNGYVYWVDHKENAGARMYFHRSYYGY